MISALTVTAVLVALATAWAFKKLARLALPIENDPPASER